MNIEIDYANLYLQEATSKHKFAKFVNLNNLKRWHFTRHGFHINYKGKAQVAKLILKNLRCQNVKSQLCDKTEGGFAHRTDSRIERGPTHQKTASGYMQHTDNATPQADCLKGSIARHLYDNNGSYPASLPDHLTRSSPVQHHVNIHNEDYVTRVSTSIDNPKVTSETSNSHFLEKIVQFPPHH